MAKYTKMTVLIRQDPIPGWGHHQEDHIHLVENALAQSVPHYDPQVIEVETVDR